MAGKLDFRFSLDDKRESEIAGWESAEKREKITICKKTGIIRQRINALMKVNIDLW